MKSLFNYQGTLLVGYENIVHKNMYFVNAHYTQKYVLIIVEGTQNYIHNIERVKEMCYNEEKSDYSRGG